MFVLWKAIRTMINIANDPAHGYDQDTRTGGVDYDCSSLVSYALYNAGANITWQNYTTHNMLSMLTNIGYTVTTSTTQVPGDIWLNEQHHVAMTVQVTNGQPYIAEAVHNEHYGDPNYNWYHGGQPGDQTGDEIRIVPWYNYSSGWDYHLTYNHPLQWVARNGYLNQSEMENNAEIIYNYFSNHGWSNNAICAMLGNMQEESSINPAIWEGLNPYQGGYGLVQWTPYTKFSDWYGTGWETAYDGEMDRIEYEKANGIQWNPSRGDNEIGSGTYYQTFTDFAVSNDAPESLANQWCYKYEYPSVRPQPIREQNARAWYNYFDGYVPGPVPSSIPLWLMIKLYNNREYGG